MTDIILINSRPRYLNKNTTEYWSGIKTSCHYTSDASESPDFMALYKLVFNLTLT